MATEVVIPPWILPEVETYEWVDEGSATFKAQFAPGYTQRQSYGGMRLRIKRQHTIRSSEEATLFSQLKATKGAFLSVRTAISKLGRGSMYTSAGLAVERLSNNSFASGTTGYTTGTASALTVTDRVLRATRTLSDGTNYSLVINGNTTVSFGLPFCLSLFARAINYPFTSLKVGLGSASGLVDYGETAYSSDGLLRFTGGVIFGGLMYIRLADVVAGLSGVRAGASYIDVPYISLGPCLQADNGSEYMTFTTALDNAAWVKVGATVTANSTTGPFGESTADTIVEDTSTGDHRILQSATRANAAVDWCARGAFKANSRDHVWLRIGDSVGGTNSALCIFDLTNGTKSSITLFGTAANGRAYIESLGNGWYYCTVICQLPASGTTVTALAGCVQGSATTSYTGNGSSIFASHVGADQCSVPGRLVPTTSSSLIGGVVQSGSGIYIKGASPSSSGLILADDFLEIGGELKQASAALSVGAAGLGYLQFEPELFRSPSDSDPIIALNPMGKFLLSNLQADNQWAVQSKVSYTLDHIYE